VDSVGNVKLVDFNLCNLIQYDSNSKRKLLKTYCGTLEYVAPEVVSHEPYDGVYCDSWSLGILLYALVYGCFPFTEPDIIDKIMVTWLSSRWKFAILSPLFYDGQIIIVQKAEYKLPREGSKECKCMIMSILKVNPTERLTPTEMLNHRWLNKGQREHLLVFNNTFLFY
jgi:serine/threonine protein kinase